MPLEPHHERRLHQIVRRYWEREGARIEIPWPEKKEPPVISLTDTYLDSCAGILFHARFTPQ